VLRRLILSTSALLAFAAPAAGAELIGVCGPNLCASTEAGAVSPLTTDGVAGSIEYASPSLSADGTALYYMRDGAPTRSGPRLQNPNVLLDTDRGRAIAVSPDGASFVFRSFETQVIPSVLFSSVLWVGGDAGSARMASYSVAHDAGWLQSRLISTNTIERNYDSVCVAGVLTTDEYPFPCPAPLARADATHTLADPTGSAQGTFIVAEWVLRGASGAPDVRSIALFDPTTGAVVRELAPGPGDTDPAFSPDGTQVAFTRGADTWVVPVAGGAPRMLAAGLTDATWGGPPATGVTPSPGQPGAVITLSGTKTPRGFTTRKLRAGVMCSAACRVTATLRVSSATARALTLGRVRVIGVAAGTSAMAGPVSLVVRPVANVRARVAAARRLRATIVVKIRPAVGQAGPPRTITLPVTLAR
jgi:WD40-like Beta Propeller Repeat